MVLSMEPLVGNSPEGAKVAHNNLRDEIEALIDVPYHAKENIGLQTK